MDLTIALQGEYVGSPTVRIECGSHIEPLFEISMDSSFASFKQAADIKGVMHNGDVWFILDAFSFRLPDGTLKIVTHVDRNRDLDDFIDIVRSSPGDATMIITAPDEGVELPTTMRQVDAANLVKQFDADCH